MATKKLTIASGKASGTHSNMPLLLVPSEVTNIGAITLAEAQSSRFYTDSSLTVEVAREVVSSDELHFKGTSVSSASEFWVDYDGVRADYAVGATYGRNAVWSDYEAVIHLESSATDSAAKISPSASNVTYEAGQVGTTGIFASASASNINMGNPSGFSNMSKLSIQCWIRATTWTNFGMIASKGDFTTWEFRNSGTTGRINWAVRTTSGSPAVRETLSSILSTGVWYMLHATFDAPVPYFYTNGVEDIFSRPVSSGTGNVPTSTATAYVGRRTDGFYWNGRIDEWRLIKQALSPEWITTEYNNQNDNGAFWVAEDAGGGGGWNSYPIIHMLQFNCVM